LNGGENKNRKGAHDHDVPLLLRNEDNAIIGTAGIFKDVTQQKALEAKLKDAQAYVVEASKMRALESWSRASLTRSTIRSWHRRPFFT